MMQPEECADVGEGDAAAGDSRAGRNVRSITKTSEVAPVNEVIEMDSPDEESGPEIENVYQEDMFEFCMDQLENGTTREARQEARDLLVNNFDEISLSEFDLQMLDAIVEKGKQTAQASDDVEQPSTSQVKQNATPPNRKRTQRHKEIVRKYWQKLKQNSDKYRKTIKRIQDYQKQRWNRMTEVEKKTFRVRQREYNRKAYHKLSVEKKREKSRKAYERIKNSETGMEKKRATERESYARQKSSGSRKFECKFAGCGKSFMRKIDFTLHERIHLGIKPFSCIWPNCSYSGVKRSPVTQHVRTKHFKLPKTQQEQVRLNIVDDRNPSDFIQVDNHLLNR